MKKKKPATARDAEGGSVTEAERAFIEVWMRRLAESARGLDFRDEEDRATFRGNVRHSMRNLKWAGMHEIATHLGGGKLARSRDAAIRVISTLYMQRYSAPAEKKSGAQLDAEIAEALAKEPPP